MNNVLDLSSLIRGLMAVIGIALALGRYPKLAHWSKEQAAESIAWKHGLPHFFAKPHPSKNLHRAKNAKINGGEK
jgi:hypothetical protein